MDSEAAKSADGAENEENEDKARQIDARHKLAKFHQCTQAIAANGEGHRAEGTQRGRPHDDSDDTEQNMRGDIDEPTAATAEA